MTACFKQIISRSSFSVVVLLGIFLTRCDTQKGLVKNSEFVEGIIEYEISYKVKSNEYTSDVLQKFMGSRILTKFKYGSVRDEYYNYDNELIRTSILNLDKKKYYAVFLGRDTVYYSDINKSDYVTVVQKGKDTKLQNHDCWVIRTSSIEKEIDNETDSLRTISYISKELEIDSTWYRNYADGAYNEIARLAPGLTIRSESISSEFITIKEMRNLTPKRIDDSEFTVSDKLVFKKMN